jgi:predicted RND superfamily exporter protein
MEQSIIKHWSGIVLKGIIILLALAFIFTRFGGCHNSITVEKHDNSQYFKKMKSDSLIIVSLMEKKYQDSLKTVASKRSEDSIKVIADRNEKLYKSLSKKIKALFIKGICDTVLVIETIDACDSVIKSKDALISQKDSTYNRVQEELSTVKEELGVSKSMVVTAQTIIKNQAEDYKTLEKDSKKALRKQKVKTFLSNAFWGLAEALTIFALK